MRYDLVISAAVAVGDTCNNWYREVSWGGCCVYSRRCRCSNVDVASGALPRAFAIIVVVVRNSKISGEHLDCILRIEWKKAERNEIRTWCFMFSGYSMYISVVNSTPVPLFSRQVSEHVERCCGSEDERDR